MSQEMMNFIKNATYADMDKLNEISRAVCTKKEELRKVKYKEAFLAKLQKSIPNNDGVSRSIKIIHAEKAESDYWSYEIPESSSPYLHFSAGYSASSLLDTLKFFEGNLGSEIAAFADSFVEVKVFDDKTMYFSKKSSLEVLHGKKQDDSRRSVLETFPIFSITPNFAENIAPTLGKLRLSEHVEMPSPDWPFSGWSKEQNRATFESHFKGFRGQEKIHLFFHEHLGLAIQKRFVKYWGYVEDRMPTDDSDFEDHLALDWENFKSMISRITENEWYEMWAMSKDRMPTPGGDFYQYWLTKLDPEKVFFRRKRKGKKRKIDSNA